MSQDISNNDIIILQIILMRIERILFRLFCFSQNLNKGSTDRLVWKLKHSVASVAIGLGVARHKAGGNDHLAVNEVSYEYY